MVYGSVETLRVSMDKGKNCQYECMYKIQNRGTKNFNDGMKDHIN